MSREFCVFYPAIWNLYTKLLLLAFVLPYPTETEKAHEFAKGQWGQLTAFCQMPS